MINGFSRRVLWLNVTRSKNNLDMHTYFNTVKLLKPCLEMLRTDCGTENVLTMTACVQYLLTNSVNAHKYGLSHSNQGMENYWSHSKKKFL